MLQLSIVRYRDGSRLNFCNQIHQQFGNGTNIDTTFISSDFIDCLPGDIIYMAALLSTSSSFSSLTFLDNDSIKLSIFRSGEYLG